MKIEQYVPFLLFSPHLFYPPMDWKNAWQNECNGREGIYALLDRIVQTLDSRRLLCYRGARYVTDFDR